jgi:hypothetical protein
MRQEKSEERCEIKSENKSFFMQKVLAERVGSPYTLGMTNNTSLHDFAIFNGQSVMILEHFGTTAWVCFKDGEEMEVSMYDLELL